MCDNNKSRVFLEGAPVLVRALFPIIVACFGAGWAWLVAWCVPEGARPILAAFYVWVIMSGMFAGLLLLLARTKPEWFEGHEEMINPSPGLQMAVWLVLPLGFGGFAVASLF